jgi:hypothetical protein
MGCAAFNYGSHSRRLESRNLGLTATGSCTFEGGRRIMQAALVVSATCKSCGVAGCGRPQTVAVTLNEPRLTHTIATIVSTSPFPIALRCRSCRRAK